MIYVDSMSSKTTSKKKEEKWTAWAYKNKVERAVKVEISEVTSNLFTQKQIKKIESAYIF